MGRTPNPPASEYTCKICGEIKGLENFFKKPGGWLGTDGLRRTNKCKKCVTEERRKYPYNTRPRKTRRKGIVFTKEFKPRDMPEKKWYAYKMLLGARRRAKEGNYPCTISIDDIIIPERCIITGMELKPNKGRSGPNSPTLDKIIPSLGYVPGNIIVISRAANMLKSNHSLEDLRMYCFNIIKWIDSRGQQLATY